MEKTNFLVSVLLLCLLTAASYASDGATKRQEMLHTSVYVSTETVGLIKEGHVVPHLAEAISLSAVKNLIHENAVILP